LLTGINILLHNFRFKTDNISFHSVTWKITFSYFKNKKLLKKETEVRLQGNFTLSRLVQKKL